MATFCKRLLNNHLVSKIVVILELNKGKKKNKIQSSKSEIESQIRSRSGLKQTSAKK
jgi:hypothetical protein